MALFRGLEFEVVSGADFSVLLFPANIDRRIQGLDAAPEDRSLKTTPELGSGIVERTAASTFARLAQISSMSLRSA